MLYMIYVITKYILIICCKIIVLNVFSIINSTFLINLNILSILISYYINLYT